MTEAVLATDATGFTLSVSGRVLVKHTEADPFVFAGRGNARMDMHHGNFDIQDTRPVA